MIDFDHSDSHFLDMIDHVLIIDLNFVIVVVLVIDRSIIKKTKQKKDIVNYSMESKTEIT